MIAADFETDPVDAVVPAERKVIAFNPAVARATAARRKRVNALYTAGTFAAVAACVAIIFVGRGQQAPTLDMIAPVSQPMAAVAPAATITPDLATPPTGGAVLASATELALANEPAPAVAAASAIANPDAAFIAGKSAAPRGLVSIAPRQPRRVVRDPFLLSGTSQAEAVYAAAVHEANSQLAWIESVQLEPVQKQMPEDLHFAATFGTEGRALGNRASQSKQTKPGDEMVTFKFVK